MRSVRVGLGEGCTSDLGHAFARGFYPASARPPPPDAHKATAPSPWTSTGTTPMSYNLILELLDIEEHINDAIYGIASVYWTCLCDGCEAKLQATASIATKLKNIVKAAQSSMEKCSQALVEASLRVTVAFLKQWLASVSEFASQARQGIVSSMNSSLHLASTKVDSLCPRWGDNITESAVRDDGCRIQLILNKDLAALPPAVRSLHAAIAECAAVGEELELGQSIQDFPDTAEMCLAAQNSLSLGRRTVNVAAPARALLTDKPSVKAIDTVMTFKATLPRGLIDRLEALRASLATTSGDAHACGSESLAAASSAGKSKLVHVLKRGRSSTKVEEAPPAKHAKA